MPRGQTRVVVAASGIISLHVAKAHPCIEHGRDEGVSEHVRVHSGHTTETARSEPVEVLVIPGYTFCHEDRDLYS